MISLFDDQKRLVQAVSSAFKSGFMYVLMQAATGSGKSVMAAYIIHKLSQYGFRIWFIVPRRELIRQMSETFTNMGIQHSFIADKYPYDRGAKVFIVSLQGIQRSLHKLNIWPDWAICDEVHFGGKGLDAVIEWLKSKGAKILGLSATPNRADGAGLDRWFEHMACGESVKWLIENKRLSEYKAFAPSRVDLSGVGFVAGEYNQKKLSARMSEDKVLIGNAVNHYKKHAMDKLAITFDVGVENSKMMADIYRINGIPAAHMDGDTPENDRRKIARDFATGHIKMLCNADLLTFGYDLSSASGIKGVAIQCMIDRQPTMSLPKQMQKWGRFLRYDGTQHMLFDHANNMFEHGLPDDDREWSLQGSQRLSKKEKQENTVKTQSCPQCYFVHYPAPCCPSCKYEYPKQVRDIEEVDGELVEVDLVAKKKELRMEVGKAKTIVDLKRIAQERGYKRGWVWQMAKAKNIHV